MNLRLHPRPPGTARSGVPPSRLLGGALLTGVLLIGSLPGVASAARGEVETRSGDGLIPSTRFHGADRFDTAALIATDPQVPDSVTDGILARGDTFPVRWPAPTWRHRRRR